VERRIEADEETKTTVKKGSGQKSGRETKDCQMDTSANVGEPTDEEVKQYTIG